MKLKSIALYLGLACALGAGVALYLAREQAADARLDWSIECLSGPCGGEPSTVWWPAVVLGVIAMLCFVASSKAPGTADD